MTHAMPRAISPSIDTIKDVLHIMDALLENKDTLLKLHDTLRKAVCRMLQPGIGESWIDAFINRLLKSHDKTVRTLWHGNMDEIMSRSVTRLLLQPSLA